MDKEKVMCYFCKNMTCMHENEDNYIIGCKYNSEGIIIDKNQLDFICNYFKKSKKLLERYQACLFSDNLRKYLNEMKLEEDKKC